MRLHLTEADIRTMITTNVQNMSPFFKVNSIRLGYDWAVDVSLEPLTLADGAEVPEPSAADDDQESPEPYSGT